MCTRYKWNKKWNPCLDLGLPRYVLMHMQILQNPQKCKSQTLLNPSILDEGYSLCGLIIPPSTQRECVYSVSLLSLLGGHGPGKIRAFKRMMGLGQSRAPVENEISGTEIPWDALGTIVQKYFAGSLESSQETSASWGDTSSVWFLHLKRKQGDFGMLTSSLLLVDQAKFKSIGQRT